MERQYKTLFDLTVVHDYYDSGRANDFAFAPSSKTAKDLKRYKLLARLKNNKPGAPEAYGLKASYVNVGGDPGEPLIKIEASNQPSMVFGMHLKNDRFLNVTADMDQLGTGEIFHYSNKDDNGDDVVDLHRTNCFLKRDAYSYSFSMGSETDAEISIFEGWNEDVPLPDYSKTVFSDDGDFQTLMDLNGLEEGKYLVKVVAGAETALETKIFLSNDLSAQRPFAILDLEISANNALSEEELLISFTRKSLNWKYFVVYKNGVASLEGVGTIADITIIKPLTGDQYEFERVDPIVENSDIATMDSLMERYPNGQSEFALYSSKNLIDFTEAPVESIELKKGAATIVKHMPGMPIENVKAEAYIFI